VPAAGVNSAEDRCRLAGQDEPQEETVLGEDHEADEQVDDGPVDVEQVLHVRLGAGGAAPGLPRGVSGG
jgi:hypothetical protein